MRAITIALLLCSVASAEKAIEQTVRRADGTLYKRHVVVDDSYVVGSGVTRAAVATGREVNRDAQAYEWARREAQILADQHACYHPKGAAPGCSRSGCGISFSPDRPNHCYQNELPESMLVARACVAGNDGRFYWSAHYR